MVDRSVRTPGEDAPSSQGISGCSPALYTGPYPYRRVGNPGGCWRGPRMKANRFLNEADDEAVSPVIAVILMVAITVVLAATVYVWVSGFGTSGSIKKF